MLSLNLADLWKIFRESHERDSEKITEWLDAIATEARALSDVWSSLYTEVMESGHLDPMKSHEFIKFLDRHVCVNGPILFRLNGFYMTASAVAGKKLGPPCISAIIGAIGETIHARNVTKNYYDTLLAGIKSAYFLQTENKIDDLRNFEASVQVLQREAAALEVLAKNMKISD